MTLLAEAPFRSADPAPSKAAWKRVTFGDVAVNVNANEPNPLDKGLDRYVGLDHLDPEDLRIKRWGNVAEGITFTRVFRAGQVLFGKRRAYQRKVAVAGFNGVCSGDILVFEAKPDVLVPELLPFIVQSEGFFQHALGTSAGSLSPRTKWAELAKFEFALPPKDEQRRIAEILWAAEDTQKAQQTVLENLRLYFDKAKDEFLPHPEEKASHKNVRCLKQVCTMQNGRPFPSTDYSGWGLRLLRPGNLGPSGCLEWKPEATRHLPESYLDSASGFVVQERETVINLTAQSLEDGFMGRVCFTEQGEQCLLNQRIGRFICQAEVDAEYLFRNLQTARFRKRVEAACEGSKIKHLYWRHIEDFPLVVPDLGEQHKRCQSLRQVEDALASARIAVAKTLALRMGLSAALL